MNPDNSKLVNQIDDEVDLRDLFSYFMARRWWILGAAAISLVLSGAASVLARPVYRADALIQVENDESALSGIADFTDTLPAESGIGAELEIVRSRSVLGIVVDALGLTSDAKPLYPPLLGNYFARKYDGEQVVEPPLDFMAKYNWGGENLSLKRFFVEGVKAGVTYKIHVESGGAYSIKNAGGEQLGSGVVGEGFSFQDKSIGALLNVFINDIRADEGSIFLIEYTPRLNAIDSLRSNLNVAELGRDTGIMRLQMEGEKPDQVRDILDAISVAYLRQNVERRSEEAQKSLKFLTEQIPQVRRELEVAENTLASFRERNKTIDLTIETESVLDKMVSLDQRLSELEIKRSELRRIYTVDHPLIGTLNEQRQQLVDERRALENQSSGLPEVQQELLRLMREVEVSTELYTFMLNKIQELRVVEAGTVGNVRIIDRAAVSYKPVKPRVSFIILVGTASGTLMVLLFLLVRRGLSSGIAEPEAVEKATGVPVYAVLPLSRKRSMRASGREGLVTDITPDSIISESFRSLRTSVHFTLGKGQGAQVILFSGPSPNVGKTFVSTNFAFTLAQNGKRVLFVDADLRRGNAAAKFGLERSTGLSELLASEGDYVKELRQFDNKSLWVLPRGKAPPNPAELLMGMRMNHLMTEWKREFDFIVIDTAPVLAVTDPVLVSIHANAVFLVARAGSTQAGELLESVNRFDRGGAKVHGVILNGMTESIASAGKYGYSYSYYSYDTLKD